MARSELRGRVGESGRVPCVEEAGPRLAATAPLGRATVPGHQRAAGAAVATVEGEAAGAAPDRAGDAARVGAETASAPARAAKARPDIPREAEAP